MYRPTLNTYMYDHLLSILRCILNTVITRYFETYFKVQCATYFYFFNRSYTAARNLIGDGLPIPVALHKGFYNKPILGFSPEDK